MHIIKIIHGFPPEYNAGSEVYTQSIVNQLSGKHKITLFTREQNEYIPDFNFRKQEIEGIDFVYVNMARAKDAYNHENLNNKFKELIENIKPDIAHIGHLNHLSTGIIEVLKNAQIPIVFTLHDFWLMCPRGQFLQRNFDGENLYNLCDKQDNVECAKSCYKMYYNDKAGLEYYTEFIRSRIENTKEIAGKVDLFIAPSKYLMNRFIDDFEVPKEKILYLDYGFPTNYLKEIQGNLQTNFTFTYIGTHIPAKGLNLLIEAFKRIEKPCKLLIFGRPEGQNTRALIKIAESSKNEIEFCGEYSNSELTEKVFKYTNCIVVPSIWAENSPLVIHEAQACKIPVITADFGGMKEYVKHKVNGLLFEHRNINDLFEKMNFALENPDLMRLMGKRAYLYSDNGEVPGIQEHCAKLTNIYENLIKKNNSRY